MLKVIRGIELAAGALAVISGAALMLSIWQGGFIAPNSVAADLLIYSIMLALVAVGVALDLLAPTAAARATALILLTIGALLLTGWFVISFVPFFGIPALLAIVATALAYASFAVRATPRPAN